MSDRPRPRFDLLIRHSLSADKLRAAVRADAALRAEAQAELAAVAPVERRCVMSRQYAEALRKALT